MSELIVDNFAGGGGASSGIEQATGRPPDIAINHDLEAIAMHTANHPDTKHYCESVWDVCPIEITNGRPVGLAWFSPDCKHFSKAKGGKPVDKNVRGLAWVVIRWMKAKRPRVIALENVEEFQDWGPLTADGKPCPVRKSAMFNRWVSILRGSGYQVDWRELRGCDYGAPTIRKRLFVIARCDGLPIEWPEPTHGPGLLPYRTAAECIDWSQPIHSIFMTSDEVKDLGLKIKRPLAENTLARIGKGVWRYVIDNADPFIVTCNHGGDWFRGQGLDRPFNTVTAARDAHGLVTAFLAQHNTGVVGHDARKPVSTITWRGTQQNLVTAHLQRQFGNSIGSHPSAPVGTITAGGGGKTALVTSHLSHLYSSNKAGGGGDLRAPLKTVTAGGLHAAEVRAFLIKYYGTAVGQDCNEPLHSATAKPRFGLVTVNGEDYQIADIAMRMLTPRELYRAQGFPDTYIIDPYVNGKRMNKTAQVRMCGNSVCPQVARAIVEANYVNQEMRGAA